MNQINLNRFFQILNSKQITLSVSLSIIFFYSFNFGFGQLLTEKSELKRQFSELNYFPNNPCEVQNEVKWKGKNK
jgi:hypothetical protein